MAGPTGEETGFARDKLTDYVLSSGGALIKDKLFYFAAASYKRDQLAEPGETAGAVRGDETSRYNLKLDWSINQSNTLTVSSQYEDFDVSANYSGATDAYTVPGAFGHESADAFPSAHMNFQSVLSSSTFFELSANEMGWNDRFGPVSDEGFVAPLIDYTVSPAQSLGGTPYPYDYPTWYVRSAAKVTHFADELAGSHEFKFGVQYSRSGVTVTGIYPGFGGKYYFKYNFYGYPYYFVNAREPHYYGSKEEAIGAFIDDSWRIGERLTLNVGVRADDLSGDIPSFPKIESYPGPWGTGVPSDEFLPAYDDVVDYDSVDPRIGLAYQVGEGTRQGVLRASYGRYHESNVASMWSGPHPDRPQYRYGYSANRYGPFYYYRSSSDGNLALPDPNLERPQTDQYALGYEQQLGNFVVGAQMVISETEDLIGWQIGGDGVYEDVPFVNPLSGETIILKSIVTQATIRKGNDPGPGANVAPGDEVLPGLRGLLPHLREASRRRPLVGGRVVGLVGEQRTTTQEPLTKPEQFLLHQQRGPGSQPSYLRRRPRSSRPGVGVQDPGNVRPALAAPGSGHRRIQDRPTVRPAPACVPQPGPGRDSARAAHRRSAAAGRDAPRSRSVAPLLSGQPPRVQCRPPDVERSGRGRLHLLERVPRWLYSRLDPQPLLPAAADVAALGFGLLEVHFPAPAGQRGVESKSHQRRGIHDREGGLMSEKGDPMMSRATLATPEPQPKGRDLVNRRALLVSTSLGIAAAVAFPLSAGAALTTQEQANLQAVRDLINALVAADWDRFSSLLADDLRFLVRDSQKPDESPGGPYGKEGILEWMKGFRGRVENLKLPMTREQAIGSMVIHQRLESYTGDEGPKKSNVTSMFVVQNGKIAEWFEYLGARPE